MARKFIVFVSLLTALCACAPCAAAWAEGPLNLWLDVPFVAQPKNGCGPASIAMVMQYWEQQRHESAQAAGETPQILQALPPGEKGVAASGMVRYFEQHGYRAFAYAGDWSDLGHEISKGRPVIAALKPAGDDDLHYVVVAGLDEPENAVLVNDPAQRKLLKEDRGEFEREWKATGYWTLLAVPAQR